MGNKHRIPRPSGIPQIITEIREELSLTLKEVEAATKIRAHLVGNWERGATSPNLNGLERLLDFYNYELDVMKKDTANNG